MRFDQIKAQTWREINREGGGCSSGARLRAWRVKRQRKLTVREFREKRTVSRPRASSTIPQETIVRVMSLTNYLPPLALSSPYGIQPEVGELAFKDLADLKSPLR